MRPERINVAEAKKDKLFYVTANAVVVREDSKALILKRSDREKVYPGKWTIVGEKIEHSDLDVNNPSRHEGDVLVFESAISEVLHRGAQEEAGITIKPEHAFLSDKIIVRPDGTPVVVLVFAALYGGGDVYPQEGDFTDFAWVGTEEIEDYDCIEGVKEDIKAALSVFKKKGQ